MLRVPMCLRCSRFQGSPRRGLWTCEAFPVGIPRELRSGKVRHDVPYPGDNGILFEPAPLDMDAEFVFDESMLEEE